MESETVPEVPGGRKIFGKRHYFEDLASVSAWDSRLNYAIRASKTAKMYPKNPEDITQFSILEANLLLRLLEECRTMNPSLPATSMVPKLKSELVQETRR